MRVNGSRRRCVAGLKELWDFDPAVGGRLVRDRVWFYSSYRASLVSQYRAQSTGMIFRAPLIAPSDLSPAHHKTAQYTIKASATYVTGSHAFKAGFHLLKGSVTDFYEYDPARCAGDQAVYDPQGSCSGQPRRVQSLEPRRDRRGEHQLRSGVAAANPNPGLALREVQRAAGFLTTLSRARGYSLAGRS